jgi:FkbM family methyltransferase
MGKKTVSPINFEEKKVVRFRNLPHDEQALIRKFFGATPLGFFVDVGANHPIIESQTYHLEQSGWDGLLIEPLDCYCKLLQAQRTARVAQFACSSPKNHNKTLRIVVAGGHSTMNEFPIAVGTASSEYAEVPCRTLDSILYHYKVPHGFDFLSIDIEGHEMEMFQGFSLSKWKPRLVLLEDHVLGHDQHRFMVAGGYQLIMRTGLNSWYVAKSLGYRLTPFARLQVFRKYWLGLIGRKIRYSR